MTTSIINGICRCCSADHPLKDLTSTYNWMGEDEIYMDMLRECFDLSIRVTPNTMGGICEVCITQLRNAYNFKKQVIVTEEMFTKKLEEESYNADIKLENKEDVDLENLEDDPNFSDYDVPIKMEELIIDEDSDEKKTKKRRNAKKCSSAKKIKTESGTSKSGLHEAACISRTLSKFSNNKLNDNTKDNADSQPKKGAELQKHRHNIRLILQSSNATPIKCNTGSGYVCAFCSEKCPEASDLKTHILEKHDEKCKLKFMRNQPMMSYVVKLDITGLRCQLCDSNMDLLEQLVDHLRLVHDKKIYTDIKSHILPFKFNEDVLRCIYCSNHFSKFKMLQEHMNSHYRNYVCDICDTGFVNRRFLLAHTYKHQTGVFHCSYCPKILESNIKKQEHERARHVYKGKTSKCSYCGERFSAHATRNEHMVRVHGAKRMVLRCQSCDKTFDKKCALTRHTKRDHLMERKHECSECEKRFYTKTQLTEHVTKHTGQRNFSCNLCLKSFARKYTLREHMRIHNNERRFQCKHCASSFVQKCSLKVHLKIQHGVTE